MKCNTKQKGFTILECLIMVAIVIIFFVCIWDIRGKKKNHPLRQAEVTSSISTSNNRFTIISQDLGFGSKLSIATDNVLGDQYVLLESPNGCAIAKK